MNSITNKVLLAVFITTAMVLCVISISSFYYLKNTEETKFEQQITDVSKQLNTLLNDPIFSYDLPVLKKIIDSYYPDTSISSIRVEDQKND